MILVFIFGKVEVEFFRVVSGGTVVFAIVLILQGFIGAWSGGQLIKVYSSG